MNSEVSELPSERWAILQENTLLCFPSIQLRDFYITHAGWSGGRVIINGMESYSSNNVWTTSFLSTKRLTFRKPAGLTILLRSSSDLSYCTNFQSNAVLVNWIKQQEDKEQMFAKWKDSEPSDSEPSRNTGSPCNSEPAEMSNKAAAALVFLNSSSRIRFIYFPIVWQFH